MFRKIFAKQPVGVLVGSSEPGRVRRREIKLDAKSFGHQSVLFELVPLIRREGFDEALGKVTE